MVDRNHLREIDHGERIVVAHHDIELVKVTVDESALRKLHNQRHAPRIRRRGIRQVLNLMNRAAGAGHACDPTRAQCFRAVRGIVPHVTHIFNCL